MSGLLHVPIDRKRLIFNKGNMLFVFQTVRVYIYIKISINTMYLFC